MSKKDEFKSFVSKNPKLIKEVTTGKITWQKLFEVYDLYGENSNVWDKYYNREASNKTEGSNIRIKDILNNIKNMKMENVEKNVSSLQKAVEFLTDITASSSKGSTTSSKTFSERPINKFFDD